VRLRDKITTRLHGRVYPLALPVAPNVGESWSNYGIFEGSTPGIRAWSCHVTAQVKGSRPHSLHSHREEEILLLLAGELDVILPGDSAVDGERRVHIRPGQVVYYPSVFSHTVETTSEDPANYLVLEWFNRRRTCSPAIKRFGVFDLDFPEGVTDGFVSRLVFGEPTRYLKRLQCHTTVATPGRGQEPHTDPYDVVLIFLGGELETLGGRVGAYDVALYAAGELHGMLNTGQETARLVALEFHGLKTNVAVRFVLAAWSFFIRGCKKIRRLARQKIWPQGGH
jgi:mannose-6-phosphate isomerase-like protein (cupin superfamily)